MLILMLIQDEKVDSDFRWRKVLLGIGWILFYGKFVFVSCVESVSLSYQMPCRFFLTYRLPACHISAGCKTFNSGQ